MKHIYLFNEGTRAASYGVGTYITQLKECILNIEDVSLNIVYINTKSEEFTIEEKNGYRIFYFPTGYDYFDEPTVPVYLRNTWSLLSKYIQVKDTDSLIFHFNFFHEYPLVDLAKKDFPQSKTVLTIHYMNWCFLLKGNTSYFQRIIKLEKEMLTDEKEKEAYKLYVSEKQMLTEVDHIICLSKYTENLLINTFSVPKEKLSLIYNGFNDSDVVILSKEEKKQLKQELLIPEDEKVILFVGRLDEIKGADILIKAFKEVIKESSKVRLIIVGDGDYPTYLNEAKGYWNKITFTGKLNKKEVYKFYQIADVGVIPSMHEQCSYVGIEMMSFGLPIIGTTSTGLNEMIPEGENFYKLEVVEKDKEVFISSETCAQYILSAINSPNNNLQNNIDIYKTRYNISSFKKNMQDFYLSII